MDRLHIGLDRLVREQGGAVAAAFDKKPIRDTIG